MDQNQTEEVVMSQSAHNAILEKAVTDATAKGRADGVAEGAKAANARIAAIVGDEKVKGKVETALSLALKSPDMKAEDVVAFVAGLPAAAPAAQTIEQRMNGQGSDLSLGAPMNQPKSSGSWDKAVGQANKSRGFK